MIKHNYRIKHNDEKMLVETIERFLSSDDKYLRKRAVRACVDDRVPLELIERGLADKYPYIQRLAAKACKGHEIPMETIDDWLMNGGWSFRSAALYSCYGREVPLEFVEKGLADENSDVRKAAIEVCEGLDIPMDIIDRWLSVGEWCTDSSMDVSRERENDLRSFRAAALLACRGRDIPFGVIARGLLSEDDGVVKAAIEACKGRDIPMAIIDECLKDRLSSFRSAALLSLCGREAPLELIEKGLDDIGLAEKAAIEACKGRDIPMETVADWLCRFALGFGRAASYSCYWRKDIVEAYDPYLLRAFEPPAKVYQKCERNVIVVAEIPEDAYVRHDESALNDGFYRASKAKIVDIIDKFNFEKVAIPTRSFFEFYLVGDEIEVEDFNLANAPLSESFHFYCTEGEARAAYYS